MKELDLEAFKIQLSINNVCYLIENKKNKLSKTSKIYIDWTKEYFENAAKSLDSILNLEKDKNYFITPYLKEVLQSFTGKEPKELTKKEFENLQLNLSSIITKLETLKENPINFYKTKDAKGIYGLLNKIKSVFA